MICDKSNVGKFSGCSICMGVDTSNGAFVYSWIDYTDFNPCGECWIDSFGYPAVYTNRYENTCIECRNLPPGSNGLSAGKDTKYRKAEDYGYDPNCYDCREKIGFFGQKSYSFESKCPADWDCDEHGACVDKDGTCFINGKEVFLPSCYSCIRVPHAGFGPDLESVSAVKIVNDCEGDHNKYGNILFPASNMTCDTKTGTGVCVCGIQNCPKSRPTLMSNGYNMYTRNHDPGCWCECEKHILILTGEEPCGEDEEWDAENCKCNYVATNQSFIPQNLTP